MSIAKKQKELINSKYLDTAGLDFNRDISGVVMTELDRVLTEYGDELMLTLRKQLEDDETDATGHLKGKLGFNTKQNSNELLKFLITAPDYWEDVNNGQPKGTIVPIEDLIDWIGHKGIDTKGIGAKSLAQVIQSIIKQKGTIKRFNYGGSRFLTNEINEQSMKDLSLLLANITGRIVGLSVAHNFKSIK